MPVPAPLVSRPPAHPVIKNIHSGLTNKNPNITYSLPVPPIGRPPSFGTREEWISSLPYWRRAKPRHIWEDDVRRSDRSSDLDFYRGLTAADNAPVIKGAHADACLPPLSTMSEPSACFAIPADPDDKGSVRHGRHDNQWMDSYSVGNIGDGMFTEDCLPNNAWTFSNAMDGLQTSVEHSYERGAFTPIFEDDSPGGASAPDGGSSPLEPITPFGDFVDRVVGKAFDQGSTALAPTNCGFNDKSVHAFTSDAPPLYPSIADPPKEPVPAQDVTSPCATTQYKKLAEPLSAWVANYVWKVCTTGINLSSSCSPVHVNGMQFSTVPPPHLAPSVHSLLLSTLLQPSAVFLAIWYIVRLPVHFGTVALGGEHVKELSFREVLLGDASTNMEQNTVEATAPFRLIVLGCMLANKWLDDHTFSNKTWHTISNVPINVLNSLESLALDIFHYDLSVSSPDWSQWLNHILSYHQALSPPSHTQPISRPSANPHSMVRRVIEEISQMAVRVAPSLVPQPVFLGLEDRRRERAEKEQVMDVEVLEIDLDEDGPLREEYLPKRRISSSRRHDHAIARGPSNHQEKQAEVKPLPPPAKWSPAGDEPILRDRNRVSGQYVAVQAPIAPYSVSYHQPPDARYNQNWNPAGNYLPIKQHTGYMLDFDPSCLHHIPQPPCHGYIFAPPVPVSHSRSHSLCYDQDNIQSCNHLRSYSQTQFEYRCSDLRLTANELVPNPEVNARWMEMGTYPYGAPTYAPVPGLAFQSTWLGT